MILDIHTHILPAVDDGAADLNESVGLLHSLKEQGVTDVVLTPHFYYRNQNMDSFISSRNSAYKSLLKVVPQEIKLHLAAETEFSDVSIDYKVFTDLGIDGSRYILLELPFSGKYENSVLPKLERFMYSTGMIPIIAHIERYEAVCKNPGLVADMIALGCLIQVNTSSVIAANKGSLVDAMLRHGQVHLLGSDCHNLTNRRPEYDRTLSIIAQGYGTELLKEIENFGEKVLANERVSVYTDSRVKKLFGKYR